MRLRPLIVPSFAILVVACGGAVTGAPSGEGAGESSSSGEGVGESSSSGEAEHGASSSTSREEQRDAGATTVDGGDVGPLAGGVYLITDDESGTWYDAFDTNLQTMTTFEAFCDGATRTAGSCCYFGPVAPPPTQIGGSTTTVAAEPNAGTITLFDVTTGSNVSTFDYASGAYSTLPMNYTGQPWHPGDVLSVTASGGSTIGAFSFEAPTLTPPAVVLASTIPRTQDLPVTWEPDPNADTWTLSILDGATGAEVVCSSAEAAGNITVDATLLSEFDTGRYDQVVATSTTVRYTQAPQGRIQLQSTGWAGLADVTFE